MVSVTLPILFSEADLEAANQEKTRISGLTWRAVMADRLEADIQDEHGNVFSELTYDYEETFGELLDTALGGCVPQKLISIVITTRDNSVQVPSSDILLQPKELLRSLWVHPKSYTHKPQTLNPKTLNPTPVRPQPSNPKPSNRVAFFGRTGVVAFRLQNCGSSWRTCTESLGLGGLGFTLSPNNNLRFLRICRVGSPKEEGFIGPSRVYC